MLRSGPSEAARYTAQPGPGARKWILLPVVWLLLVGGAVGLAFLARSWLPYLVGGILCIAWLAWMLAAALSPARPDRRCPRCGEEKLLQQGKPLGVSCTACGTLDPGGHVPHLSEG